MESILTCRRATSAISILLRDTGEKLSVSLGKIKKWFTELKAVAFSGSYSDLANKPAIPTNTSDLTNDSNFVSDASYVHTDNNYTSAEKTKLAGVATGANKTVIDTAFNTVSSNPASSTAIAAWVDGQIANGSLHKIIVTTLPSTNIDTNAIYLVLKETASEKDIYNEYLNMNGTTTGWEFIGSSAVDLTNYYTKTESNNLFAFKAQTGNVANLNTTEKGDRKSVV